MTMKKKWINKFLIKVFTKINSYDKIPKLDLNNTNFTKYEIKALNILDLKYEIKRTNIGTFELKKIPNSKQRIGKRLLYNDRIQNVHIIENVDKFNDFVKIKELEIRKYLKNGDNFIYRDNEIGFYEMLDTKFYKLYKDLRLKIPHTNNNSTQSCFDKQNISKIIKHISFKERILKFLHLNNIVYNFNTNWFFIKGNWANKIIKNMEERFKIINYSKYKSMNNLKHHENLAKVLYDAIKINKYLLKRDGYVEA